MDEYKVSVKWSSRPLTKLEEIKIMKGRGIISVKELMITMQQYTIEPAYAAILAVHNPRARNADYEVSVIVDKSGYMYQSGSSTFKQDMIDYFENCAEEIEKHAVLFDFVYQPSKNYKDRNILMISIREKVNGGENNSVSVEILEDDQLKE